jgi:hypothetical protein
MSARQQDVAGVSDVRELFHDWPMAWMMRYRRAKPARLRGSCIWMGRNSMKKFQWSDWLVAAAIVMALGAYAGAEAGEEAPVVTAAAH